MSDPLLFRSEGMLYVRTWSGSYVCTCSACSPAGHVIARVAIGWVRYAVRRAAGWVRYAVRRAAGWLL